MITKKGTSLGVKSSAMDRLITDGVTVCLRHNKNDARDQQQALLFATNVDDC